MSRYITLECVVKKFQPDFFLRVADMLGRLGGSAQAADVMSEELGGDTIRALFKGLLRAWPIEDMSESFANIERECHEYGFRLSALTVHTIVQYLAEPDPVPEEFFQLIATLRGRLNDEMPLYMYYALEPDKEHFAKGAELFGQYVDQQFRSTSFDIEEGGKCLAFDRGTACIFHLMRVLEVGLYTLADALGVQDIEPNWHNAIEQIEKKVRGLPQKTTQQKDDLAFYSEAATYLFNVKEPWRNRTAHAGHTYTVEKAEQVFESVRGFMQVLATRLTEKPL